METMMNGYPVTARILFWCASVVLIPFAVTWHFSGRSKANRDWFWREAAAPHWRGSSHPDES